MKLEALIAIAVIALAVIAQRRGWIDLRGRHSTSGGNAFAVFDELFAPQKHAAAKVVEAKRETRDQQGSEGDPMVIRVNRGQQ